MGREGSHAPGGITSPPMSAVQGGGGTPRLKDSRCSQGGLVAPRESRAGGSGDVERMVI